MTLCDDTNLLALETQEVSVILTILTGFPTAFWIHKSEALQFVNLLQLALLKNFISWIRRSGLRRDIPGLPFSE